MTVRNENEISFDSIHINGAGSLVGRDERVEQERLASSQNREARMPIIGEFHNEVSLCGLILVRSKVCRP